MSLRFVDQHAHLSDKAFDLDRDSLLSSLKENGLSLVISVGEDLPSSQKAALLAKEHDLIYSTAGIHPHNASQFKEESIFELKDLFKQPKVRALGEIGLDYHYTFSPKETQRTVFQRLLILALELKKPVVIHNRDSDEDMISILKTTSPDLMEGVIHCFTSNLEMAKKCLDLGFYISFSGIMTFKKSFELREVAAYVPMNRILVETDSPYLAPQGKRGKRNEPAYVRYVAETLASIKNLSLEEVATQTSTNAFNLYKIERAHDV